MKQIERRRFTIDRLELRSAESGAKILAGHAAVFNRDSEEMWGFTEQVAPGAFTRAIQEDDVRALFNHDSNYILGRNRSKTLRLSEDAVGLAFEVDLPDTQYAKDLTVSVERGDVTGCSFSFATRADKWVYNQDGSVKRTILDVELCDVGPVTFPAYPDTDVAVRSVMQEIAAAGKKRATGAPAARSKVPHLRRTLDLIAKL
jgi:HK97 family phage prohead protease